jgi:hypothetical protein
MKKKTYLPVQLVMRLRLKPPALVRLVSLPVGLNPDPNSANTHWHNPSSSLLSLVVAVVAVIAIVLVVAVVL